MLPESYQISIIVGQCALKSIGSSYNSFGYVTATIGLRRGPNWVWYRTDVRCPSRTAPPDPFQNHQKLLEVRTKTEVRRLWMLDGCQVLRNVAPRRFSLCCACPCLCSSCNRAMLVHCISPLKKEVSLDCQDNYVYTLFVRSELGLSVGLPGII